MNTKFDAVFAKQNIKLFKVIILKFAQWKCSGFSLYLCNYIQWLSALQLLTSDIYLVKYKKKKIGQLEGSGN